MSKAANARLGTYSELGQRYRGTCIPKGWVEASPADVGAEVGLERDGDDRLRVHLGDVPDGVDWVLELRRQGNSTAVHLPPLAAHTLGLEEVGQPLAQERDGPDSVLLSRVRL